MQGYLYVEAHKESHVTDATRGLRIIYHSKGARLVPLKEMVSAIYVNQQAKSQLGKLLDSAMLYEDLLNRGCA